MKINITEGVQKWFAGSNDQQQQQQEQQQQHPQPHAANKKLELLIDCSGCGSSVQPVLFASSSQKLTALKLKVAECDNQTRNRYHLF